MYLYGSSCRYGDGGVVNIFARAIRIDVVVGFPKELVFGNDLSVAFELDFVIYFGV